MPQEEMVEGIQNEQNPEEVEAVTTEQQTEGAEQSEEEDPRKVKKFSEEDLERIVKRRLAQQHKKFEKILNPVETELDRREREVTQREFRAEGRERLLKEGLPTELIELMNLSNKDEFEDSYTHVLNVFKKVLGDKEYEIKKAFLKGKPPIHGDKFKTGNNDNLKSAFAPKE